MLEPAARWLGLLGLAGGLASAAAEPRFQAQGHDPRWQLRLLADERIEFEAADGLRFSAQALFRPDGSGGHIALGIEVQGQPTLLTAERRLCHDARDQTPYPWQVSVTHRGRAYLGCGGDPLALLRGAGWKLLALSGGPPLTGGLLSVDEQNRVHLHLPCNRLQGQGRAVDGGLQLSGLSSTRMACPTPEHSAEEAALQAFLPQVARFELDAQGLLQLHAADGRRLQLRRD